MASKIDGIYMIIFTKNTDTEYWYSHRGLAKFPSRDLMSGIVPWYAVSPLLKKKEKNNKKEKRKKQLIFQYLADWIMITILQYLKSILNTNTFILYCSMLWDKCTVCVTEYSHNRSLTVTYGQNWRESYVFWICIFSKKKESNWQTDLNARRQ